MGAVLAFETSQRQASVAWYFNGEVHEAVLAEDRAHASDLVPQAFALLESTGQTIRAVPCLAVGTGPGSYTGLRVGLATVLGLARALEVPVVAIPSGEVVAAGALVPGESCHVLRDAYGGDLYWSSYRLTSEGLVTERQPSAMPIADVRDALRKSSVARILGDSGTLRHLPELSIETGALARARTLAELALERARAGQWTPLEELEPLYLKPFAAKPRKR